MPKNINLRCSCGQVTGELKVVPGDFFHVQCLCCDCQSFAAYLENKENILDQYGASELLQTYPEYLKIAEGQDKVSCVQLKEKGLYRWYASCCNTPIANTMTSANIPFVGLSVKLMQFSSDQEKLDAIGPVSLKAFGKYSVGEMPKDVHKKFPLSFLPKIMVFMLKGILGRKAKPSPFFKDAEPVVPVKVLS